jgi:hypothetical protein
LNAPLVNPGMIHARELSAAVKEKVALQKKLQRALSGK